MHTNSNSILSKNIFFKVTDYTNDNLVFKNAELLEEISISSLDKLFIKGLLTSEQTLQVISNLKSIVEAIEIFKQRNVGDHSKPGDKVKFY